MARKRYVQPLSTVGILCHPCDLDLVLFFHRHPSALLTIDRLAAYVGYDLTQVGASIERLTEAGLLGRSQDPTQAARLYVLLPADTGWMTSLIELASTPEGRRQLIVALRQATEEPMADQATRSGRDSPCP